MKKLIYVLITSLLFACSEKLDQKPDSNLVIPETAQDFENILDNSDVINRTPALAQLSADEYFIPSLVDFLAVPSPLQRSTYIWDKNIFQGLTKILDWSAPYNAIFYCNNVLDQLATQDISRDNRKKNIKGWALFSRAYSYYTLASIYCKAYDESSAANDLGLPLKLNANIDQIVKRSNLSDTYTQIIIDIEESSLLLEKEITTDKRNRPSQVAANALLARVYLSMRKYDLAEKYANQTLAFYSKLLNYNTLNTTSTSAFTYSSAETIYHTSQLAEFSSTSYGTSVRYGLDTSLIRLYDPNDLRLKIYFRLNSAGNYNTKAVNGIAAYPFTGLASDEIYLIKAECLARRQHTTEALSVLNELVKTRMVTGKFTAITASDPEEALNKILTERRKALVWRSLRWTDLKRLNLEGRQIFLVRYLNGKKYQLAPNSPGYVLPIPDDEVALTGIEQNPR
jgi:starch-binding outer membrane protein, SusD/RagB family